MICEIHKHTKSGMYARLHISLAIILNQFSNKFSVQRMYVLPSAKVLMNRWSDRMYKAGSLRLEI